MTGLRNNPRTAAAFLVAVGSIVPIVISFPDWEAWQWPLGSVALLATTIGIWLERQSTCPYVVDIGVDDWGERSDGALRWTATRTEHKKPKPTVSVGIRTNDGGISPVSAGVEVMPDGAVHVDSNQRFAAVVTIS